MKESNTELYKKIEASRSAFERWRTDEDTVVSFERHKHNGEYVWLVPYTYWCAWCKAIEYTHKLETDKITMPPINLLNIGSH